MNYCSQNTLCWTWKLRGPCEQALYQTDTAIVLLSELVSLFQLYQTLLGLMKLSHHPHRLLLLHLRNQCQSLSQSLLLSRYDCTGMVALPCVFYAQG